MMNRKKVKELAKFAGAHYHPDIPGKPNRVMFWEHELDKFILIMIEKFSNKQELYEYFEVTPKE